MTFRILIVSLAALAAGSLVDYARAEVGYVCDGNVVVMVAPGELERLKRENACVASHFGLTVEVSKSGSVVDDSTVPLPIANPRRASASGTATAAVAPVAVRLRGGQAPAAPSTRLRMFAGGSVRLLNAAPGAAD